MKKLTYKNDWESDYYFVDGKNVNNLKKVKIKNKEYKVKTNEVDIKYTDHGVVYNALSDHYFITEKVFGINMEFDLNTIVNKTNVYVLEYE